VSAPRLRCFAVTAPGLESLAAGELRAIVARPPAPEPGGVAFDASPEELYAANLWLRTASRVTVRLAEFTAESFRDLERFARRVPWETVADRDRPLRLRVTCRKSRLYHSDAVAERVADAVAHRVGGDGRFDTAGPDADDAADGDAADGGAPDAQLLVVRFFHDRCTISADSSGALLHRRGYRQAVGKAPLRETLAAALLLSAGYDGSGPLVDPLCGAGTLPIEAALIARRLAPGRGRRFAFERWPGFDAPLWDALRGDADAAARPYAPHPIVGSDRDAGAVRAAADNAARAGVADDVAFAAHALSAAPVPAGRGPGWLATNPPYGKRVGEVDAVRDLWARLGQFARVRCPGWQVAVFAPDATLGRQLALPLRPVLRTANGGLPVQVLAGTAPARAGAA
jgi:putative N6-adenine-specific DNA methylase